ncbi:DUF72 domain-containing protein [soil metagenome]
MEFGHLDNLNGIAFSLPPDHPETARVLAANKGKAKPAVYVGGPVWADPKYVGSLYPRGTKSKDFLQQYCRQFNAIEVNATHYKLPTDEAVKQWLDAATPGFKFSLKVPQNISHSKAFGQPNAELDHLIRIAHDLGNHLGTSFLLMPPYFKPNRLEDLRRFLKLIPADMPMAVEVRNEEWFNDAKALNEWTAMLESLGRTAIITDVASRRDVLHMRQTSGTAFIRYNGYDLHPSDFTRLDEWVVRLGQWLNAGLQEVYFYMHQPTKALSAELGAYFIEKINALPQVDIPVPVMYNKEGLLF